MPALMGFFGQMSAVRRSIGKVFAERAPDLPAAPLPMTPPDYSVLLLAWDDADPGVAVLGGSALPPTLPLVYELAAHHPVVALYPHLPPAAPGAPAPGASEATVPPLAGPAPGQLANPLDVATNGPGVHLLPASPAAASAHPAAGAGPRLAVGSRIVGLDDLLPPTQAALGSAHQLAAAFGGVPPGAPRPAAGPPGPAAPGRSQWPTPPGPPASWQAPAAPYAGASAPPASLPGHQAAGRAEEMPRVSLPLPAAAHAGLLAPRHPNARLLPPPPPLPPRLLAAVAPKPTAAFEETVEEMGTAEASDLDAPDDDLTPNDAEPVAAVPGGAATPASTPVLMADAAAPKATAPPATTEATAGAAPGLLPRQPRLDGLNFRMIQYARRALQLVAGHGDFGVIYAPGWPAWLAALEIRNRTGRPLVLYVAALASDTAAPAQRGWLQGIERMALRRARLVLVPDAAMQQDLCARHGADLGEVRVVPADDEVAIQLVLAEIALG